jgi:hypothetical protein
LLLRQISKSLTPQWRKCFVTAKQIAEKKYVVKLSEEERQRLNGLTHVGHHPSRRHSA